MARPANIVKIIVAGQDGVQVQVLSRSTAKIRVTIQDERMDIESYARILL